MKKQEFLNVLRWMLSGLPEKDLEERLSFYSEMIDDRIEEGLTEEEAVRDLGPIDKIAAQIIADTPFMKIAKERVKPKRHFEAWETVLLVIASPLLIVLSVLSAAIMILVYAVLWSLIISLWAVFVSLCAIALAGIFCSALFAASGNILNGAVFLGSTLFIAGLSIFFFLGCLAATKLTASVTKKIALAVKKCFMRKERSQ